MIIRVSALVISMVAVATAAAVKRDDYGQAAAASGSQPVYSPSSVPSSYSSSSSNFASQPSSYQQPAQYSSGNDQAAAATSGNFQSQPNGNNGNLYYYYYPVQDKPKDSYQAAASNQYTSAVTPNFGGQASASSDSATQHLGDSSASSPSQGSSGSDLNYSAQDLSYSAQTLGQGIADYSNNAQSGSNYDQSSLGQLTNLASQLQQYSSAFAPNQQSQQSYAAQPQAQQSASGYSSNYYEAPQGSHASGSEQTTQYQTVAQQIPNQYQAAAANAFGAQAGAGQINAAQLPASYHQAAAAQAAAAFAQQYPGAQHFGNFPAASGQHGSFEPAASGYRRYGIGSFLMPMLALAGLSLLIPTVTSLTASSRKKRSLDPNQSAKESAFGNYFDRLERYYSIYKTAVEKEECRNRIICELGDVMAGVRGKSAIFTVLEKVVPNWMGNSVGVLKSSALAGEQYGKCKKWSCQK